MGKKAQGISRRTVLKGMGASTIAIALPPLEAMFPTTALAQAAANRRYFVLGHWPQGVEVGDWRLSNPGSMLGTLPLQLQDFNDLKGDINLVSGLSNYARFEQGNMFGFDDAHHRPNLTFLTATGHVSSGAGGPSIDQVAAKALGGRSLVTAAFADQGIPNGVMSWQERVGAAPGSVPAEVSPKALFAQLFGSMPQNNDAMLREKSILDFVKESFNQVNRNLPKSDIVKLDEHLTQIRELEKSILQVDSSACSAPLAPNDVGTTPGTNANIYPNSFINERSELMVDLVAMALRCDLTRVAFYSTGSTNNIRSYPFVGINVEDHELSHRRGLANATSTDYTNLIRTMTKWKLSQLARFLRALKQTPVADKTLLDQCVVTFLSEFSEADWHITHNLPVIVAGGGMQTGRYLSFPCNSANGQGGNADIRPVESNCSSSGANTPLSNLFLTMLRALGATNPSFGDSTGTLSGLWV